MLDFRKNLIHSTLRKVLKRLHYPLEVMLTCVRWYVALTLPLNFVALSSAIARTFFAMPRTSVVRIALG